MITIKSCARCVFALYTSFSICNSEPIPSTMKILEKISKPSTLPDNFIKRQKKLNSLKALLEKGILKTERSSVSDHCDRFETKINILKKIYEKQYSMLNNKNIIKKIGTNGLGVNYFSIMEQMQQLMKQMEQRELSLTVKYEKALHCHKLFLALEKIVSQNAKKSDSFMVSNHSDTTDMSKDSGKKENGRNHGNQVITISVGEIDHAPHNNRQRMYQGDAAYHEPIIIVPASLAVKHGLDKIAEEER